MKHKFLVILLLLCLALTCVFVACKKPEVIVTSTVTFDSNGATGTIEAIQGQSGTKVNLPRCTLTRDGYEFLGWSETANGSVKYTDKAKYTFGDSDVTLYAVWDDQTNFFKVSFDANGGLGAMATIKFEGSLMLPVCTITRTGYNFKGWSTTADGNVEYEDCGEFSAIDGCYSATIYAVWEQADYTLTFLTRGGSEVASQTLHYGDNVTAPKNPTKSNCTFLGWNRPIPTTMPDKNITITALWKANSTVNVTITFDANGGTGTMTAQKATWCDSIELSANAFTRSGYVFKGWSTAKSGNVEYLDGATMFADYDVTLYAIWQSTSDSQAVSACITAIEQIGTEYDSAKVKSARDKFDALSALGQSQITNYDDLLYAEYQVLNGKKAATASDHVGEVVTAVANAYYIQSSSGNVQIHYDQFSNRRHINANPEEATAERMLYLDCSSYVNAVYYYTFGKNLLSSGTIQTGTFQNDLRSKKSTSEILVFQDDPSELSDEKRDSLIAKIQSKLQPGDVLNYRHDGGSAGHIMLYIGDGKFMHSTGVANDTGDPSKAFEKGSDEEYTFGSVNVDDWLILFEEGVTAADLDEKRMSTTERYLFASNVTSFCFFRPTDKTSGRYKNSTITEQAVTRWLYDGLTFETSSEIGYANSAYVGQNVTFTIDVQNCGDNNLGLINVKQVLPEHTKFVSASDGGVFVNQNNTIYWQLDGAKAHSTQKLTFTVQIDQGCEGEDLIVNGTYVNNLRGNALQYPIASRQLDEQKFVDVVKSFVGKSYSNVITAAKAIYKQYGMEILNESSEYTNVQNVLNDVLSSSNGTLVTDTGASKYLVPSLYLGTLNGSHIASAGKADQTAENYYQLNYNVRRVMENFLEVGDIIIAHNSSKGTYVGFLYCGKDGFYGIENSKFASVQMPISNGSTLVNMQLSTLWGYRRSVILRPSKVV